MGNVFPLSKMKNNKKGIAALVGAAVSIFILIFVVTIAAYMTGVLDDQQATGSISKNVSTKGLQALDLFGDWFKILVVLVIMVVIISLILGIRFFRQTGGGF